MTDLEPPPPDEPPTDAYEDKLPPADVAAERALLGACLVQARALDDVAGQVSPADFYRPAHGELFATMLAMHAAGQEVDAITVANRLGDRIFRIGGHPYLIDLMQTVVTAANAGYYAEIITGKSTLRRLLEAGQRTTQLAYSAGDPAELVERARQSLDAVAGEARGDVRMAEATELAEVALTRYGSPEIPGLSTGWADLDAFLSGGLRPGTLTVVGARPGIGKSVVGCNVPLAASLRGHGSLIVSLEMTEAELTDRLVANIGSVYLDRLIRHQLSQQDWQSVEMAADRLRGIPLAVTDHPSLGLTGIRSLARDRVRSARGLSLLVVDYLGLIRPADERVSRQEQVSAISRGLKLLAKELAIPVMALHQLNRGPEQRADRRPMLADLRESGAIEQDADTVILLHRDEQDEARRFEIDFIIAKNRQGKTGTVQLNWVPQYARITGYENSLREVS